MFCPPRSILFTGYSEFILSLIHIFLDLTKLLASLESLFHAQALEKGLTMRLEDGRAGNRHLLADSLRLNQVLVNIIGNAVKFTDRGGITMRLEELETEPRAVYRFSVTDTGSGIEPSSLTRIFNPFEQADASTASRRGGTGLGLSISYRLVQMMGGKMCIRDRRMASRSAGSPWGFPVRNSSLLSSTSVFFVTFLHALYGK